MFRVALLIPIVCLLTFTAQTFAQPEPTVHNVHARKFIKDGKIIYPDVKKGDFLVARTGKNTVLEMFENFARVCDPTTVSTSSDASQAQIMCVFTGNVLPVIDQRKFKI